jgi:hypothetical protein
MYIHVSLIEDRIPFPEHISLNFSAFSRTGIEKITKQLRDMAERRSWTFGPCELPA